MQLIKKLFLECKNTCKDILTMLVYFIPTFILGAIIIISTYFFSNKPAKANAAAAAAASMSNILLYQQQKINERPAWFYIYNEDLDCNMSTRHYILYLYSIEPVEYQKVNHICTVINGKWEFEINNKQVVITNPSKIDIDHIVPWSFLKQHINKKDYKEVYNIYINLIPIPKTINQSKSNKICDTKERCETQKDICNLIKVELATKNIKNTIDCNIIRHI